MAQARDIGAFEARARHYDQGWRGRLHRDIADRSAHLALCAVPAPARVLDVGCGTGYLLGILASRLSQATQLVGIDPAPSMIDVARTAAGDGRLRYCTGLVEDLPYPADSFDLVVSTTSFDHWRDQLAGLRECNRVLRPGARLVLVDQFSLLLAPTLLGSRRVKARTKHRANRMVRSAGFDALRWHGLYTLIINAVVATA